MVSVDPFTPPLAAARRGGIIANTPSNANPANTPGTDVRRLVRIETVTRISAIPDADAIESVGIGGWNVVAKKGTFVPGDTCVYFEIDSALPVSDARFEFLAARGTKTLPTGVVAHVLSTAKLRGVYSQGLALPLAEFPEFTLELNANVDLAALLGVEKWEPPIPASYGDAIGPFPTSLARKTDAERIQNLAAHYDALRAYEWVATEKIDGTSATFVKDVDTLRVCGRNWELSDGDNVYWRIARTLDLEARLQNGDALQGEIFGEGVQGNPLRVKGLQFGAFGFFRNRCAVARNEWPEWAREVAAPTVAFSLPESLDDALALVDGMASVVNSSRKAEGIVLHTANGEELDVLAYRGCFKIISNSYLLKNG